MMQYPYPIRLTPIWGKTMRQFSERFSSCRTQQEYTQVGMKIFRFFRMEGSNRFPDRRRIPTCEARHGDFGQPRFRRLDGIAHGMIAFCRRRCSFPQFVGTVDLLLPSPPCACHASPRSPAVSAFEEKLQSPARMVSMIPHRRSRLLSLGG